MSLLFYRENPSSLTSVKEGFGDACIAPLVRGLPVAGREIPHIARDFREKGIVFEGLYRFVRIPADAVDGRRLGAAVSARVTRLREAFGAAFEGGGPEGRERLESLLAGLGKRYEGGCLDFGSLDAECQAGILKRAARDAGFAGGIGELNPELGRLFDRLPAEDELRLRREAVLACYSNRAYGELLAAAYEAAAAGGSTGAIDKAALAERYLVPGDFFLSAT